MYVSTLVVLAFSGVVLINDSSSYTYSYTYSFEPNYAQADGEGKTCSYDARLNFLDCGTDNELEAVISRYRAVRETTTLGSNAEPWEKDPRTVPAPDQSSEKEYMEWRVNRLTYELLGGAKDPAKYSIMKGLSDGKIRYRKTQRMNVGQLPKSAGITIGITALWYFCTLMIYKVTLYVAYGHTRIRKV